MASTNFQDYNQNTPIVSAWLNDVNNAVYGSGGGKRVAQALPAALVRFSVVAGVVTVEQSVNIQSVVRISAGVYVVTYGAALINVNNVYQMTSNIPGFVYYAAETTQSVTVNVSNTSNVPTDPGSLCVTISGAN